MMNFEKEVNGKRILLAFWPKDGLTMAKLDELRTMVAEFAEVPPESIIIRYAPQKGGPGPKADGNRILATVLKYFTEGVK